MFWTAFASVNAFRRSLKDWNYCISSRKRSSLSTYITTRNDFAFWSNLRICILHQRNKLKNNWVFAQFFVMKGLMSGHVEPWQLNQILTIAFCIREWNKLKNILVFAKNFLRVSQTLAIKSNFDNCILPWLTHLWWKWPYFSFNFSIFILSLFIIN